MKYVLRSSILLVGILLLLPITMSGVNSPLIPPSNVVVGLKLRNESDLDNFILDVSNPSSPNFQKFLTQEQFNDKYAPTIEQETKILQWLQSNGFATKTYSNHLIVSGSGGNILSIKHVPENLSSIIQGVVAPDQTIRMKDNIINRPILSPKEKVGNGCCAFAPSDLKTFYNDNSAYQGNDETIVIAGAYAWLDLDVQGFNQQWNLPDLPSGSSQTCTGTLSVVGVCVWDPYDSLEVSLDVEYAHATAPKAVIKNYMAATTFLSDFDIMYNQIVVDNPGHIVSTSWGACESEPFADTSANIIKNGVAIGQSWFAASGDDGSNCQGFQNVLTPASIPYVVGVGGTSAYCTSGMTQDDPKCHGYKSEDGWSGSGGGYSLYFSKPSWQTGCGVDNDNLRDIPDVSSASDPHQYGNYVLESQLWWQVGGTSSAAPEIAGIFAKIDQRYNGKGLGLSNPRLYELCNTDVFHDIVQGNNGAFSAKSGYDEVTGIGSLNVDKLIVNY